MNGQERRHVLVLGDQLTRQVGPLSEASPHDTRVLMIEADDLARAVPHHKQKLVLFFSAMRHFAQDLERSGFSVDYRRCPSLEDGVAAYVADQGDVTVEVMQPTDWGYEERLERAATEAGGSLRVVPNDLWLTTEAEFDGWAKGRKTLRLEYFYRAVRKRRGWLMEGDQPAGGRWNYDADNRKTPEDGQLFPQPPRFPPDPLTRSVMNEVEAGFPNNFGSLNGFSWPVSRAEALEALDDFLEKRLAGFGPYEDAMVEGAHVLYHSLLSPALNLGLLHPLEVCERAMEHALDPAKGVPLQSIEGFVRQILGWREFVRHVYRTMMPEIRSANGLQHSDPLPGFYWGAPTRMRCVGEAVRQLHETGHTHHIQRLMVLGNFALISRVDPRELNDWFLACYVDALDWVVTPNVMGMSQFADLGSFTTKPYAASGKYILRMSDHCKKCDYDPGNTVGDDACPMNSLYWDFLDHHAERFSPNPRMALMLKNWQRRDPKAREDILLKARKVRSAIVGERL